MQNHVVPANHFEFLYLILLSKSEIGKDLHLAGRTCTSYILASEVEKVHEAVKQLCRKLVCWKGRRGEEGQKVG